MFGLSGSRLLRRGLVRATQLNRCNALKGVSAVSRSMSTFHSRVQVSALHSSFAPRSLSVSMRAFSSGVTHQKTFPLADIGEGIAECEVLEWFVKEGDTVEEFDNIVQVQSDKATVDIPSRYAGIITKLHYEVGEMAAVGDALVTYTLEGEGDGEAAPVAEETAEEAPTAPGNNTDGGHIVSPVTGRVLCSPAVRTLAKQNGLDLATVPGTGPKGRILKEDVQAVLAGTVAATGQGVSVTATTAGTPAPVAPPLAQPVAVATSESAPVKTAAPAWQNKFIYSGQDQVQPIQGLERIMVKTMNDSNAIPQFLYCDEIQMNELNKMRKALGPLAAPYGAKLSGLSLLIKAASLALVQFPQLNAHVNKDCTEVIHKASHNIAIAVDTPRGLLVPNVKDCQNKSILEIGLEVSRLAKLGRDGQLGTHDLTGGTFTLSNIGSIGGTYASPLVVPPEVMIGALGKTQTLPRFDEDGNVVAADLMNVSWSADHRVVDGATVARFSNLWKDYIENPTLMLLHAR